MTSVLSASVAGYELGPPADPLTLALAMTETFTLTAALADALTAAVAQARALPLWVPMVDTTAEPVVFRVPTAFTTMGPCT